MVKTESFMIGQNEFIRTYSDKGMMIHGGSPESDYAEACDPAEFGRTYTETDIPNDDSLGAEEILDILLGGGSV